MSKWVISHIDWSTSATGKVAITVTRDDGETLNLNAKPEEASRMAVGMEVNTSYPPDEPFIETSVKCEKSLYQVISVWS